MLLLRFECCCEKGFKLGKSICPECEEILRAYRESMTSEITLPVIEKGFVLYDEKADRYRGKGGIPRVFPSKAQVYRSIEAAEKELNWWQNKRFKKIKAITLTVEDLPWLHGIGFT